MLCIYLSVALSLDFQMDIPQVADEVIAIYDPLKIMSVNSWLLM
jgi:hypothetical protein